MTKMMKGGEAMIKKSISFLLVVVLLMSVIPTVGMAAEEPEFYYELSVNGNDTVEVSTGDVITVSLVLSRTDADEPYTMFAMQDEIRYDSTFFKLVEDSEILYNGVINNDISVGGEFREYYMNYVSMTGGKQWKPTTRVGSFQLEVIATGGMTTITNEDFAVSLPDGSRSYVCDANSLTVIISTECIVRFVTNGGSKIDNIEAIYGEKISRPADPTRPGKEFVGWYKDIQLSQPWDFDNDVVTGNMSLYAKWKDVEVPPTYYSLSFNTNDGVMSYDPSGEYVAGTEIVLPVVTREGYVFTGWDDGEKLYAAGDKYTVNSTIMLVAHWEAIPAKMVTFSLFANGGQIIDDPSGEYPMGTEITLPEATREGFIFTGWGDGINTFAAGDKIKLEKSIVSLTAQFEKIPEKKVTVTLDGAGGEIDNDISGEVIVGSEIVLPTPTREGYIFKGWSDGKEIIEAGATITVAENLTLEAVWEKIPMEKVNLTLNANGGTINNNPSGEYPKGSEVILPEANREGFVFKGWNDGTTVHVAGTTITLAASVSMTAEWESAPAEKVTLKLDLNGGKLSWDPSGELAKGTVLKLPAPTREGFVFNGWKLGKVVYAAGDEITLNESMTFKASWNKATVETEKVTYTLDLNGGTLVWDPSGEYPIGTVVKLPTPYRAGYVFDYWECNDKIYAATMEITLNEALSFKAVWVKEKDEIVWKPDYNIDSLITDKHVNYVVGYPDGTILPKKNITRAEVAVIFYRLLSEDFLAKYQATSNNFLDVKDGMWHNKAISTLSNAGILTGYPDGNFYPNKNITRAELAAIIDRFAEAKGGEASFSDVAGHWAYENIATAEVNGWITGYPDGTFQPNKAITRAETFAVVNRLLGRFVNDVNSLLPGMNEFIDNMNTSAWYYFDVQEATNNHDYTRNEDGKYEKWTKLLENIVY